MSIAFVLRLIAILAGLAWPWLVWYSIDRFDMRLVLAGLLSLLIIRAAVTWKIRGPGQLAPMLPPIIVIGIVAFLSAGLAARLYPVVMSLSVAGAFFYSWLRPPTLIEQVARLSEPDLPPAAIGYMRKVTIAWILVLIANACLSLATLWWGDMDIWLLYNGLLSYLIMGSVFAVEYGIRLYVRRRHRFQAANETAKS